MNESTELINEILQSLNIDSTYRTESLSLLEKGESRYIRDLKLNLASTLTSEHLSAKECALIGLATAVNNNNVPLIKYYTRYADEQGATGCQKTRRSRRLCLAAGIKQYILPFPSFYAKGKIWADTCTHTYAVDDEARNR